jgi:hypothetical protein
MAESLFDRLAQHYVRDDAIARPKLPETVTSFLGRLLLLHGVPFRYLVPDESLLTPESLKFFHIDREWVQTLIDGALSVGRPEDAAYIESQAMAGSFSDVGKAAREVRQQQRAALGMQPTQTELQSGADDSGRDGFSGFLLRSRILSGWPGIQIRALGGSRALSILRLERVEQVSPVILFGLVAGKLDRLELTQPPEGLHFHLSEPDWPALRWRLTPDAENAGVLDVAASTAALKLEQDGSAGLAKRLIAQPLRQVFNVTEPEQA